MYIVIRRWGGWRLSDGPFNWNILGHGLAKLKFKRKL